MNAPKKKKNTLNKGIVLLIGLLFVFYIYNQVSNKNFIENLMKIFDTSMSGHSTRPQFPENKRNEIIKKAHGFWTSESNISKNIVIQDRLEITNNGYIWQVESANLTLPSGDCISIEHVYNGYFFPSSIAVFDTTWTNVVIRNMNQLWIYNNDTCIVKRYVNEEGIVSDYIDRSIDVFVSDSSLIMKNKHYQRYSKESVDDFFPQELIEIVYNLNEVKKTEEKMYTIKNKQVILNKNLSKKGTLNLENDWYECSNTLLYDYLRRAIAEDLQNTTILKRDQNSISKSIKHYYEPGCIKSHIDFSFYKKNISSFKIKTRFDITANGDVENVSVEIPVKGIDVKWKEKELIIEINKWKFEKLEKNSSPFSVTYDFSVDIK